MFDEIPTPILLLVAILAFASLPARYVFRYVTQSPSSRDITQPTEDFEWRSPWRLGLNLALLAVLAALAVFIFTPAAARFAASASFPSLMLSAFAIFALSSVIKGALTGRVTPMARGFTAEYDRHTQPKRFWGSMGLNVFISVVCIWVAVMSYQSAEMEGVRRQCFNEDKDASAKEMLATCTKVIEHQDYDDPAPYYFRGLAYLHVGEFHRAEADLTQAHEWEPNNASVLALRGIARVLLRKRQLAEGDFVAVRAIEPDNPLMLRGEAVMLQQAGDLQGAVDKLTASLKKDPGHEWTYRARADAYWRLGQKENYYRDKDELWRIDKEKRNRQAGP